MGCAQLRVTFNLKSDRRALDITGYTKLRALRGEGSSLNGICLAENPSFASRARSFSLSFSGLWKTVENRREKGHRAAAALFARTTDLEQGVDATGAGGRVGGRGREQKGEGETRKEGPHSSTVERTAFRAACKWGLHK